MHKSKNYDMAAQIAMDKLMPKPVQITISMQGGGGLSNLNENIVYRQGGGGFGYTPEDVATMQEWQGYTDPGDTRTDDETAIVRPAGVRVTPRPPGSPRGPEWEPLFPPRPQRHPDLPDDPMKGRPQPDKYKSPEQRVWDELGIWRGMGRSPQAYGGISRLNPQVGDWWSHRYDDVISDEEFMRGVHHTQEHFDKPFYDRDKEGLEQTPDYNTEANVIAKIRAGHQDFLTPKEKEVWDRMQGIIGEDDSYLVDPVSKQVLDKILDPSGGRVDIRNMRDRPTYRLPNFSIDPDSIERYRKPGYVRPFKAASGGGISSLNDSININGQPHRLVWANPKEERVLKDMGGSGKPGPGGMPSYQTWGDYPTDAQYDEAAAIEDYFASENYPEASETSVLEREVAETVAMPGAYSGYNSEIVRDLMRADDKSYDQVMNQLGTPVSQQPSLRTIGARQVEGLPWLADKNVPAATQSYNLVGDLPKKGFLGLMGDPMNMSEAIEGAYKSGFTKWRAGIGMYEADAPKAYNEWFAKQNPEDLVKGYKIGDPVGYSTRSAMNRVNKQLKNKFQKAMAESEEDVALSGGWETDELSRKELQDAAKGIEGIEDFTPFDGSLPDWMPAWMKAVGGFASRTVIGYGKVGGVPVHIHEDGTVTAISPEDSPGYDHAAQHEPGGEVPRRYRPKTDTQASISETVTEKEPSALERLLASRSEPSSLAQLDEAMQARLIKDFYSGKNIFSEFG